MDTAILKTFISIAENGSFLAAANAVSRSPAAVSVQIRKLEESLGATLFERDARSTKLTSHGLTLLPHARRMVAMEAEIFAEFDQAQLSGAITLGVPDDVVERFPMNLVTSFCADHPNVLISMRVDHTPALLRDVDNNTIDLAIITYAKNIPGVEQCELLLSEPEVWVMSATGIAAEKTPIPVILWDKDWAWYHSAMDILNDANLNFQVVLECENITARKSAIEADFGIGPLPASQMSDSLVLAPRMQDLPKLPDYGLGLKMPNAPNDTVLAIADRLRNNLPKEYGNNSAR